MHNRAVSEVPLLAKQLSVVGSDGDPGSLRYDVEQSFEHTIEVLHRIDLPGPEPLQLLGVEETGLLLVVIGYFTVPDDPDMTACLTPAVPSSFLPATPQSISNGSVRQPLMSC